MGCLRVHTLPMSGPDIVERGANRVRMRGVFNFRGEGLSSANF